MVIEKRDGGLWADIFWDDLSANVKAKLLAVMGNNGNYDVFPLASINVSSEEDDAANTQRITAKMTDDGWVDGTINGYRFQAKVYDTVSKFGINKGRVGKLEVWNPETPLDDVLNYDRGWDRKPGNKEQEALLQELLGYLEVMPPQL